MLYANSNETMSALEMSEPSSPQSFLVEPDTPGPMNRACLLDDSDDCDDLSSVTVPETPRYIDGTLI